MTSLYNFNGSSRRILRDMYAGDSKHFVLGNPNYYVKLENSTLRLRTAQGALCLSFDLGSTQGCCGVQQLCNFTENTIAKDVPDEILDEVFKLALSTSYWYYNKSFMNAYFYKSQGNKHYNHPTICKMFIRGGMKRFGRAVYNPNSGNVIRGYQLTISRKVARGNS